MTVEMCGKIEVPTHKTHAWTILVHFPTDRSCHTPGFGCQTRCEVSWSTRPARCRACQA